MSADVDQQTRERAYAIWLEEGCPDGCDFDHWVRAQAEVAASLVTPVKSAKKVSKPSAAKPAAGKAPAAKAVAAKPAAAPSAAKKTVVKKPVAAVEEPAAAPARRPRARKVVPA